LPFFGLVLQHKFTRFFPKIFAVKPLIAGLVEELPLESCLGIGDIEKFLYVYPKIGGIILIVLNFSLWLLAAGGPHHPLELVVSLKELHFENSHLRNHVV
jgi:hypothetical protein